MGRHYNQLDLEERCRILAMQEQGITISRIARHLGRFRRTMQNKLANVNWLATPMPTVTTGPAPPTDRAGFVDCAAQE